MSSPTIVHPREVRLKAGGLKVTPGLVIINPYMYIFTGVCPYFSLAFNYSVFFVADNKLATPKRSTMYEIAS